MIKLVDGRPNVETLLARWTADAVTLTRYGQEVTAAVVSRMAEDLREAFGDTPAAGGPQTASQELPGALLTVDEAAERIGMSKSWLYRHGARLPFSLKLGTAIRFDPDGLAAWLRSKGRDKAA
jgi:predicted DNA-binding transcriptional regulator AlpA